MIKGSLMSVRLAISKEFFANLSNHKGYLLKIVESSLKSFKDKN